MIEGQSWRDVKAPPSLRDRVLRGPSASRPSRLRSVWIRRTVVALGCTSLIGLATLLPQRSSAAASLDRVVTTQERSTVMFQLLSYSIDANGKTPKVWSGYVKGNRWHYIQDNFEQAFDGVRMTTYIPGEALATSEVGAKLGSGNILGTADLSSWKIANRKNLTMEQNALWQGRQVDVYAMQFRYWDSNGTQREGTVKLYVDPQRNLPLYQESLYTPTSGHALEWNYIDPANEELLRIKLPEGIKIRQVTTKSAPLSSPEKASAGQL